MAYATLTQVQAYIAKFAVVDSGKPNTSQAQVILDGVDAEINVALALVSVSVPFVSDGSGAQDSFDALLTAWECWGAAATILHDFLPGVSGPDQAPLWSFFEKKYQAALKSIKDLSGIPPAIGAQSPSGEPASYYTRFPDTESEDGDLFRPEFTRESLSPGSVKF